VTGLQPRTCATLILALSAALLLGFGGSARGAAADACAGAPNPILCENALPGNPASEWDIAGSGDPTIQGFATEFSVADGEDVSFKIKTDAVDYRVEIYRMGYYGGAGAAGAAAVRDRYDDRTRRLRELGRVRAMAGPGRRRVGNLLRPPRPDRHRRR
jgi:hypothetical protein